MAREGLMDDAGYQINEVPVEMCEECKHLIVKEENGTKWAECEFDFCPGQEKREDCTGSCARCGNTDCTWYDDFMEGEEV